MKKLSPELLKWFDHAGRHDLPWQKSVNPYRTWVSEIMLQQTQVKTVIPYFNRFMQRFPDLQSLGKAPIDEVLHLWSGLGYYARGRNLHKTAQIITSEYDGIFPADISVLISLPGIGRSTAGAILSLSQQQRHPILDGNVKRVLTRYHGITGWPGDKQVEQQLWKLAEQETPKKRIAEYTQAIMDLGATVCTRTRPACDRCPLAITCYACVHNLQTELPTRKGKKALPQKQAIFVIIENKQGEVLLQKRPPTGIWGGLWSLPECPQNSDILTWIKQQFGSTVSQLAELPSRRHTFSHFHLEIRPYRAMLRAGNATIRDEGEVRWYHPGKPGRLGIAAPVKKILLALAE